MLRMTRPLIGRTIRRLRQERSLTQAGLAARLGISASYLNLIEHDERAVTASLLIKLTRLLDVNLEVLAGTEERSLVVGLREALSEPLLGAEAVGEDALAAIAAHPVAARAILAMSRAWAAAREDASGLALPSGHRIKLPHEEARALFNEHANHFPALEQAAEAVRLDMQNQGTPGGLAGQSEMNHAIAERLRSRHGLTVRVAPLEDALRVYDPVSRLLILSDLLKRESRGFHMAFQLMLIEAHEQVEALLLEIAPSSREAASIMRIGLLNYVAAALLMPYASILAAATALRYDVEILASRFAVSHEQAAQRLSTLQRPGQRGVPLFFLRMDAAGNITKAFSGAGFHFTHGGGSCPRWIANTAFASPGRTSVQVAQFPDHTTYLCFARVVVGTAMDWNQQPPVHVIAMGCEIGRASELVYGDGIDLPNAITRIGLSCRLCDWTQCRSRAHPPLSHRLSLDVNRRTSTPMVSPSNGDLLNPEP